MQVEMHFGDGSFHQIEVESINPEEAVHQAKDWVHDNAWFVADNGEVQAELYLFQNS